MTLLCPCCCDPTPLPDASDAGRIETARACVRAFDDEHRAFFARETDGELTPEGARAIESIGSGVRVVRGPARSVLVFGVPALRRHRASYSVTIDGDTYMAHDENGRWAVAIHDAASHECFGHGGTIADAERACLRDLGARVSRWSEAHRAAGQRRAA